MITVQNTRILITDSSVAEMKPILSSLSVWNEDYHRYTWCSYLYDKEKNLFILPGGYPLDRIIKTLPDHELVYDTENPTHYRNITLKMKSSPRDDLQFYSIKFLDENDSSVRQKFLCLRTGKGKTFCTINHIANAGKVAMIIVDRDSTIQQWKSEFLHFTNIKDDQIYCLVGSNTVNKIMNMDGREIRKYKIFLASHRTLGSFNEEDYQNIDNLFQKIGLGIKVYDEAHVEWKNQFFIDCGSNIDENIYLTATPDRSNPIENKVFNNMYNRCSIFGLKDKYKEKYVNLCYVTWNSKPSLEDEANMQGNHGFDSNAYSDYLYYNNFDGLMIVLDTILQSMLKDKSDRKIAIIFQKNNIIDKVYNRLKEMYPNLTYGKFCGLTNKKDKMNELNNQIILSTGKSLDKATNIKGLEVVINFMTYSSPIIAEQVLGRLRFIENTKLYYFDVTDIGFKACKKQAYYRKKTFNLSAKKSYNLEL